MPRKPIYVDMDNVLIAPIIDLVTEQPIDLIVRPGVEEFLQSLNRYGDLYLLTAATSGWARQVLVRVGPVVRLFKQVITGEDLFPIAHQIDVIRKVTKSQNSREELYRTIEPILPPGVVFDDFPVGSDMFLLKGIATGIAYLNPHLWIQVDGFFPDRPDQGGLVKAFQEFRKRNASWRERPAIGNARRIKNIRFFEGSLR